MAMTAWLADKSALVRLQSSVDAAEWLTQLLPDYGVGMASDNPKAIPHLTGTTVVHT